jgi:hypothetical protein
MTAFSRISLIVLAALLSACASQAPAPTPQPTEYKSASSFNGNADDVLFRALGLVGTPYRNGGNTPEGGFDCSGLIGFVYRDAAGIKLPRTTRELISMRAPGIGRDALQSGDLVFFCHQWWQPGQPCGYLRRQWPFRACAFYRWHCAPGQFEQQLLAAHLPECQARIHP